MQTLNGNKLNHRRPHPRPKYRQQDSATLQKGLMMPEITVEQVCSGFHPKNLEEFFLSSNMVYYTHVIASLSVDFCQG